MSGQDLERDGELSAGDGARADVEAYNEPEGTGLVEYLKGEMGEGSAVYGMLKEAEERQGREVELV
ncbi:hypothetical protein BJ508DRAFT_333935 [Ascobolus immersus RN42]|uniref:Uncharacterized protein n=1 Tax=Ascobolus immersus RN42 TaxID=1160509 RepID=A0A3N4HK16_ASCIM|nr:hypothetical protein BJ508DRAFT_333935 [Ascobolus immersus RN42]